MNYSKLLASLTFSCFTMLSMDDPAEPLSCDKRCHYFAKSLTYGAATCICMAGIPASFFLGNYIVTYHPTLVTSATTTGILSSIAGARYCMRQCSDNLQKTCADPFDDDE